MHNSTLIGLGGAASTSALIFANFRCHAHSRSRKARFSAGIRRHRSSARSSTSAARIRLARARARTASHRRTAACTSVADPRPCSRSCSYPFLILGCQSNCPGIVPHHGNSHSQ